MTEIPEFTCDAYDVAVIGAGHAGCEAALAAARLGCETICFTVSTDTIAMMPCNPNIGGTSKGHLVREVDALGGEMGRNIDRSFIQSKMLNGSKGPAVHSLRAQADKQRYTNSMRHIMENTTHLTMKQAEVSELCYETGSDGVKKVTGVKTVSGAFYPAKAVILASGVYLNARCIFGEVSTYTGPNGTPRATHLTDSLIAAGIEMYRFKTGTPARIDKRSIDFSVMEEQYGDEKIVPFSFTNKREDIEREQVPCYLTYTNEETHKIIRANLDRSPLFSGAIEGTGPRYCPSIEDKVVKFPDKDRHQIFLEPEGEYTNEIYLSGMSSSLPEEVQIAMYRSVRGLENAKIVRNAYAIEYDGIDARELRHTLESKRIGGLYFAGQVNGTTGYEEAGGQGILAGINAHISCHGGSPFTLARDEAYIGVLVDDLITKGVDEPYRMFTSRAEYRILLRQDDADLRLTQRAYNIGLATKERYDKMCSKRNEINRIVEFAKGFSVKPALINDALEQLGTTPLREGCKLADLIERPQLTLQNLADHIKALKAELDKTEPERKEEIIEAAEILMKYSGYIGRERLIADKMKRLEDIKIKGRFDYDSILSLSTECRQKLIRHDPETLAEASRIPGVSPSDINVLLVLLNR